MKHKFIIDAGHGGVCFGHYLTPGKRSPEVPPGIYEGEFNRKVAACLDVNSFYSMYHNSIEVLNSGPINISLRDRVRYVNQLHRREPQLVLVSIHANAAAGQGWSKARGSVVFHALRASAKSKQLAHVVESAMVEATPKTKIKSRGVKSANFTIISKTTCPAILIECGFMTNKIEAKLLAHYGNQYEIASAIYRGLENWGELQ